jgi:hypothetical protein
MARDQGSLNLVAVLWWSGIAMDFSLSLLLPQAAISWKRTSLFFVGICFMLLGIAPLVLRGNIREILHV